MEKKKARGEGDSMRWRYSIIDSMDTSERGRQQKTGKPGGLQAVHGVAKSQVNNNEGLNSDSIQIL